MASCCDRTTATISGSDCYSAPSVQMPVARRINSLRLELRADFDCDTLDRLESSIAGTATPPSSTPESSALATKSDPSCASSRAQQPALSSNDSMLRSRSVRHQPCRAAHRKRAENSISHSLLYWKADGPYSVSGIASPADYLPPTGGASSPYPKRSKPPAFLRPSRSAFNSDSSEQQSSSCSIWIRVTTEANKDGAVDPPLLCIHRVMLTQRGL